MKHRIVIQIKPLEWFLWPLHEVAYNGKKLSYIRTSFLCLNFSFIRKF